MISKQNISTDSVTFEIQINGQKIENAYQVKTIGITKTANRISAARLILYDGEDTEDGFKISNSKDFLPGNKIVVLAGYNSDNSSIFKGIVIKQGLKRTVGRFELCIDCKHVATAMTINLNSQYFYNIKDSGIIEEITQSYGITTEATPTKVTHKEMVQYQVTDWEFMVMRAQFNGQLVFSEADKVSVNFPDFKQEPALILNPESILDIELEMDARYQLSAVSAHAWNPADQTVSQAESDDPKINEQGNLSAVKLAKNLNHDEFKLAHNGAVKDLELQVWADSKLLKSRLAKIRGRVKIQGNAAIALGSLLKLEGIGDRFDGPVYITGIRHQINAGNWETDLQFGLSPEWFQVQETKQTTLVPSVSGLQTGIVVQLKDDPEGEGRILVRSPLISEHEDGIWARVNCLDAGANRGAFFRPEIDDEVLLGFIDDDPRHPVVIGMLNSSAKPAPLQATDENPEKGFVTKSGLELLFDDELKQMTLKTPAGNSIIISEASESILIEDSHTNKIEMTADGISIESAGDFNLKAQGDINIEGTNISQNAKAEFKAEGGAGAELSTGAIAVLKGSIVQIN
ncbi:MAG: type VI secretion system tip protein VgrG [Crocinitomix sp.]|nr:type VI secretion system tip protein VgrG [Crocinitomix sp.]